MKSLNEVINEAIQKNTNKSFTISNAFDFKLANDLIHLSSDDIDNEKLIKYLDNGCDWDDKTTMMKETWSGSGSKDSKLYSGRNGVWITRTGTLSELGEDEVSSASVVANIIRLIGCTIIKNNNSPRSIVGAVKKELVKFSESSGKNLYFWSASNPTDDSYVFHFEEKFEGLGWTELFTLILYKK